jgi:hypothetical protein
VGRGGGSYRILVGKLKGKRPIGRFRRRWEDNIKINLKSISWETVNWIDLAQDRDKWRDLVDAVMNFRVP